MQITFEDEIRLLMHDLGEWLFWEGVPSKTTREMDDQVERLRFMAEHLERLAEEY